MPFGQTPFTRREYETIAEVFSQYEQTPAENNVAWSEIVRRWRATSGRFYAYNEAHNVAAGWP